MGLNGHRSNLDALVELRKQAILIIKQVFI
jgi:hypothetical protein